MAVSLHQLEGKIMPELQKAKGAIISGAFI
jgi:hypothetical protein